MAQSQEPDSDLTVRYILERVIQAASGLPDLLLVGTLGAVLVVTLALISRFTQVPGLAILAVVVLILGVAALYVLPASRDLRPRIGDRLQVGVLSFAELGTVGDEEAMGDGFAEELITRLSRVDALQVKPRHTMLRIKDQRLSTRQIIRRLGVHYLVDGTLRQQGDRLRVTAGVIRAWDGDHWRNQWSGSLAGLFDLQSDVAEGVARHLMGADGDGAGSGSPLDVEERTAVRADPSRSVEANVSYMRGRSNRRRFNNGREAAHFQGAERAFHRALEVDPEYVDAWAELGFLYLLRWETDGDPAWLERAAAAFREVERRVPEHEIATTELGYIALVEGNVAEGLERIEGAAGRHPHETIPQNVLALAYLYLGFYESAVAVTERVAALDPDYAYPPTNAATACILMGRPDQALSWTERARAIDATAFVAWLVEGTARFHQGRLRAARRAWNRGLEVAPDHVDPLFEVTLAWLDAADGDEARARAVVSAHRDDMWLGGTYDAYFISLCALAGELDLAVDLLERQTTWSRPYRYLVSDPTLRPLRGHPRFDALVRKRHAEWCEVEARHGRRVPIPPDGVPSVPESRPMQVG